MKNLLLLGTFLLSTVFYAQVPVWVNGFDTAEDMQGWVFYDQNENSNGWIQGKNIINGETTLEYGTSDVLRYSINLVPSGLVANFATENDWAVTPQIDLTHASGEITLAALVGRQRIAHDTTARQVFIFVSTPEKEVPELTDFLALETAYINGDETNLITIGGGFSDNPFPDDLAQFVESKSNLSAYAGKKIYLGILSNRTEANATNMNIDQMGIFAAEVLSNNDPVVTKQVSHIVQNPANSHLITVLNPLFIAGTTSIIVYNMAGQEVLSSPYNQELDINILARGFYFVQIINGNDIELLKFIKK